MKILYLCASCREVHYDKDYCATDGDYIITEDRFYKILANILNIKEELSQAVKGC